MGQIVVGGGDGSGRKVALDRLSLIEIDGVGHFPVAVMLKGARIMARENLI